MALPTFDLQTRTHQKKVLAACKSWAHYVWLIGIEVMAKKLYPNARIGDKVCAVALCPYPYIPYFVVRSADPSADPWLTMFLSLQPEGTPILCERATLERITDEYIVYEWPRQLGEIYQDIICSTCGMVQQANGVELAFGVELCNEELCISHHTRDAA